jgi:hypothetical protein
MNYYKSIINKIMKTETKPLVLDEPTAKEIYPTAPAEFKKVLEQTFGKKTFLTKMSDILHIYEDCVKYAEDCEREKWIIKSLSQFDDDASKSTIAHLQVRIIAASYNQGWKPSRGDRGYFPVFDDSSGFGFSGTPYNFTYTLADLGSRLVFETSENAADAGKKFTSIFKNAITL